MANMSYCMWENTSKDMYDTIDKIQKYLDMQVPELIEESPSSYEINALIEVLNAARQIVDMENDIEDLYEELNSKDNEIYELNNKLEEKEEVIIKKPTLFGP